MSFESLSALNKKILIVSNNPLSDMDSNGRTMKNFFSPADKENLAQIYLHGAVPDFSACSRFFRVSDGDVLRSFLQRKSAGREVLPSDEVRLNLEIVETKRRKKTPLKMLLRDFFWSQKAWRKKLKLWVDDVAPETVLLQAGDSPFMYRLATEIAKEKGIPLVIYNSEDYYFQTRNYTRARGFSSLLYPVFHKKLKEAVKSALAYAACSIYISEDLKATYDAEFAKPSEYIYTATEMRPCESSSEGNVFSYLGNFGYNRHEVLVKIANALAKINPSYKLDVYGKIPSKAVEKAFSACSAISYHGLVDYATVCRVMQGSTLLFHAENFKKRFRRAVRHGFSTKIADSLASGSCFVIFAPPELSCTKYLAANECACVITDEADLEAKLCEVIENADLRRTLVARAKLVAAENHNAEKNRAKMARILQEI